MYRVERRTLDGRVCTFFVPEGCGPFPTVCLCTGDADTIAPVLSDAAAPPVLYYHAAGDWERDFTPWPAPALPKRDAFAGGAPDYLAFLRDTLLPHLGNIYPVCRNAAHHAVAGYSLGGLFALWALFESDVFGAAASLSGSLWYEGWTEYLFMHTLSDNARVYLSLGRSEEHTGNRRMAAVGENTRRTYAHFVKTLGDANVVLEWNCGGHFTGIPNRWSKAMAWISDIWRQKG